MRSQIRTYGVLEHRLHRARVGDEVRREIAAIELQPFDDLERRLGGLRLLDRDDAVPADLLHRVGDELADRRIVVRRNRRDLRLLLAADDGLRLARERLDGSLEPALEPALQVDRARAGRNVAHAFRVDRMREYRRRARAVADGIAGFLGGLPQHLRAEIFLGVLELHLLRDRDAVVAHDRSAPLLLDQHRLRFWAERDADGVRERRGAAQHLLARVRAEQHLLDGHESSLLRRLTKRYGIHVRRSRRG